MIRLIWAIKGLIWDFKNRKFKDSDPNQENYLMKHIWGIKAGDNLSGITCGIHTLNDFDITYYKRIKKYVMSIETIYDFEDKHNGEKKYLLRLLDTFTSWMTRTNRDTSYTPELYEVFTKGINVNTQFDTIEELYGTFKYLVESYCD